MALPRAALRGLITGLDLMKGMAGDYLLLKLISDDYANFSHIEAKLKPNHEAYDNKMGNPHKYKAVLLYMDCSGIDFDAKTGLAKIHKSMITEAIRSEWEGTVDEFPITIYLITKPELEDCNEKDAVVKKFNHIVIALLPYERVEN